MKKSIEFELRGESLREVHIHTITKILERHIGDLMFSGSGEQGEQAELTDGWYELEKINFSNYYVDGDMNNPKITKPIKKILLKYFPERKDLINEKYPFICHEIASLYNPSMKLKSFWGDKSLLGDGVYEPYSTCFGKDGCNYTSRKFIEGINRVKTLVIELEGGVSEEEEKENLEFFPFKKVTKKSRCLAYFAGDRSVYLTNFYYQGIPQSKRIFVEALRRMLGVVKVSWKEGSFPLQMIYLNRDCIRVRVDGIENNKGIKYPPHVNCPVCEDKVPFKQIRYETHGNDYIIGCSEDCISNNRKTCDSCGGRIDEDESYSGPEGDGCYCQSCYSDLYSYCEHCGYDVDRENMIGEFCNDCACSCKECEDEILNDKALEFEGNSYCENCYSDKIGTCEECSSEIERGELREFEGFDYCEDCYQKGIGTCKDCGMEFKRDELINHHGDDLCENCLKDRKCRKGWNM